MRHISNAFMSELQTGSLKPILKEVQLDDTLDLELRGNKITIYYRGGALFSIIEENGKYNLVGIDPKYRTNDLLIPTISLNNISNYIKDAKHLIDFYVTSENNKLWEKEIQQLIVRENNYSANSSDTDFFIVDIEETDNDSRFDIIALQWNAEGLARKSFDKFKLTIIEVKQGINSLRTRSSKGTKKGNPGLKKHQADFERFIAAGNLDSFNDDMLMVFKQKCVLGLIKANRIERINLNTQLSISGEPKFVCILANYKQKSKNLVNELAEMKDCKFFISSFTGYGLYHKNIVNKQHILELLNK